MKPLITVAVPVNNTVRDLPTCIDSLLTQTYTDFELLLLDDGSDALCRAYARRDSRIRFVPLRHKGVSAARNRALETARGAYITFVDADDRIEPDYLARLSAQPFPSGDALVVCGMTIDHADGRSEPFLSYPDRTISRGGDFAQGSSSGTSSCATATQLRNSFRCGRSANTACGSAKSSH